MTKRKPPLLPAADNAWIEEKAINELERLPTHTWENMVALWRALPALRPSTQCRILARLIELAAARGDPFSAKLVKRLDVNRLLEVPERPRSHIRDQQAFRNAAKHQAKNPKASLGKLAKAAGVSRERVRLWKQSAEFQRWVREFEVRNDPSRIDEALTRETNWEFRQHAKALKAPRRTAV
jgi:hypothetical protein